ncbi:MAG: hypothetical protein EA376_06250 [Phycisphaeraceae bacterium]|nr:MAG: hypothetical protein EA376_06250 [Phycisphaeraceae bacterium]
MNKALGWIKSNLAIVIIAAVAIIALPTLLFLSARMSTGLRNQVQSEVDEDYRAIQQISARFRIPSLDPTEPAIEFTRPPNQPTIDLIRERIEDLSNQSEEFRVVAERRNREGKRILLGPTVDEALVMIDNGEKPPGLFPEPDSGRETRLRQEVSSAWIEAHRQALRRNGAGAPPSPQVVLQQLQSRWDQERSRLMTDGRTVMDEEDQRELRERLTAERLSLYRQRAQDSSFYADMSVFAGVSPWTEASLPTLPTIWDWQHRLWVHEDLLAAIARANIDPDTGAPRFVPEAAVKRVERIRVNPWRFDEAGATPSTGGNISSEISRNFDASITGRAGWPLRPNPLYDTRYAELTLIVASDKIIDLINGFSAVNFMTVIDIDIEHVDHQSALAQGYVYGADHVVRARITVETLWLRSWMSRLMPPEVRNAVGVGEGGGASGASNIEF